MYKAFRYCGCSLGKPRRQWDMGGQDARSLAKHYRIVYPGALAESTGQAVCKSLRGTANCRPSRTWAGNPQTIDKRQFCGRKGLFLSVANLQNTAIESPTFLATDPGRNDRSSCIRAIQNLVTIT